MDNNPLDTSLDVYKRQTWIRFKSSKKLTEKYMAILHSEEDNYPKREKQAVYGAVSYTHLDVYKRQIYR